MTRVQQAERLLAEADLLFAPQAVQSAVTRMASEITASLKDEFPVVLSVMGGAAVFTSSGIKKSRPSIAAMALATSIMEMAARGLAPRLTAGELRVARTMETM